MSDQRNVITRHPGSVGRWSLRSPITSHRAGVWFPANLLTCLAFWSVIFGPIVSAENWPQWRGPRGDGLSNEQGMPTQWQPGDAAWNIELPGVGHSSPIVWDDRVFITAATDEGRSRHVLCYSASSGQLHWQRTREFESHKKHAKNSYASSTPACDGERVYVTFADPDSYRAMAFSLDGEPVWDVAIGGFASQHGMGASPIVFEDLVIIPNDQDGPSGIVALDRRSGQVAWQTPRAAREASYATPLIIETSPQQKPQLICVSGATGITSLDPWAGTENWTTGPMTHRTVAAPVFGAGLVFAGCGQGGKGILYLGVEPTGSGQLPDSAARFRRERLIPYVPSVTVKDGLLFLWQDQGVLSCIDLQTDAPLWSERIGGQFSASPLCVRDVLYAADEQGIVTAVAAGRQFKKLGQSSLGGDVFASPAAANGRLIFRTTSRLIAITGSAARATDGSGD